jgi:subtilisin family serine protease
MRLLGVLVALAAVGLGVIALRGPGGGSPEPLPEAWALVRVQTARPAPNSADVLVGVVDSGVDGTHPALRGRVLSGIDFVDGGPGDIDPFGHGTQVAGIIAGGEFGVAPNARIVPVRVLDARGSGTIANLSDGIRWSADNDTRVINASVETGDRRKILKNAVEYAWARGSVVIAIAGNQGGAVQRPAAYRYVVAVGAVDESGKHASFSARGSELDLVAPGVKVRTTAAGGGYVEASGTSVAAPFVSAAAALLLGGDPGLTNEQVVARLRGSARDLGTPGFDTSYGAGLLDVAAAMGA